MWPITWSKNKIEKKKTNEKNNLFYFPNGL